MTLANATFHRHPHDTAMNLWATKMWTSPVGVSSSIGCDLYDVGTQLVGVDKGVEPRDRAILVKFIKYCGPWFSLFPFSLCLFYL